MVDKEKKRADFHVENHGTIVLLYPLTRAAVDWAPPLSVDGNVVARDAVVVEPRYIEDIIRGIRADGLTVR